MALRTHAGGHRAKCITKKYAEEEENNLRIHTAHLSAAVQVRKGAARKERQTKYDARSCLCVAQYSEETRRLEQHCTSSSMNSHESTLLGWRLLSVDCVGEREMRVKYRAIFRGEDFIRKERELEAD